MKFYVDGTAGHNSRVLRINNFDTWSKLTRSVKNWYLSTNKYRKSIKIYHSHFCDYRFLSISVRFLSISSILSISIKKYLNVSSYGFWSTSIIQRKLVRWFDPFQLNRQEEWRLNTFFFHLFYFFLPQNTSNTKKTRRSHKSK